MLLGKVCLPLKRYHVHSVVYEVEWTHRVIMLWTAKGPMARATRR